MRQILSNVKKSVASLRATSAKTGGAGGFPKGGKGTPDVAKHGVVGERDGFRRSLGKPLSNCWRG